MSLKLAIETIGAGGDGIARLDRQTFYVPQSCPGDVVLATPGDRRGNGVEAIIDEIVTPGPHRQKPPCRHFNQCGGCLLQHLDDEFVADWKRQVIIDQLDRAGVSAELIAPTLTSPERSRRRVDFIASRRKKSAMIGFHQRRSRQIFDIGDCPVLHPRLLALVKPLRAMMSRLMPKNSNADIVATLANEGVDIVIRPEQEIPLDLERRQILSDFANEQNLARISWQAATDRGPDMISARKAPTLDMGDIAVSIPPAGFLQATEEGEMALAALAKSHLANSKFIVDLFCGCGSFTFALATQCKLHAVDSDPELIDALQTSANQAMQPVTSEVRNLFRRPLTSEELKDYDGLIFDPPRAGAKSQADEIARSQIPSVVAISCNPASFARDARKLVDGGYRLERVVPVDQFRWSAHVELIGLFSR